MYLKPTRLRLVFARGSPYVKVSAKTNLKDVLLTRSRLCYAFAPRICSQQSPGEALRLSCYHDSSSSPIPRRIPPRPIRAIWVWIRTMLAVLWDHPTNRNPPVLSKCTGGKIVQPQRKSGKTRSLRLSAIPCGFANSICLSPDFSC